MEPVVPNEVVKKEVAKTIAENVSIEPLILKLDTNPEPSDWAVLLSYYRIVHHSINSIRSKSARISLVRKVEEFKRIANKKLRGVAEIYISVGTPYLRYKDAEIPLGYSDIWTIMATKNNKESIEKTVEMIYKKFKGEFYNTKYYPIEERGGEKDEASD